MESLASDLQGLRPPVKVPFGDFAVKPSRTEYFKPSTVMGRDSYRTKTSIEADFQPRPTSYKARFRQVDEPPNVLVSNKWFKDTEEFCRRCSIATGQAIAGITAQVGMLEQFTNLHSELPELKPTQFVFMTALVEAQKLAAAAAANFELVKRDHVLQRIGIPTEDAKRARSAPFGGDTFGPGTEQFVSYLYEKTTQQVLGGRAKYLHGTDAYRPKVIQLQNRKESSFRIPCTVPDTGAAQASQGAASFVARAKKPPGNRRRSKAKTSAAKGSSTGGPGGKQGGARAGKQ